MNDTKKYTLSELKGSPIIGCLIEAINDPINLVLRISQNNSDIVLLNILGQKAIQVNNPDIIRHIFIDNQKNYIKSKPYIRFEPAIGLGLLTSNGDKWKRDRQKIQPMFNREQISGYYFEVTNFVTEKYKQRWLKLTENGKAELNITEEMARITTEVILRSIFGDKISDNTVSSLHNSYSVLIEYLKSIRVMYNIDLRKLFCHPAYFSFKKELAGIDNQIMILCEEYRREDKSDKYNMLSLLINAQKADPTNFSEKDIRDHAVSMVFAGFESTSIMMQWLWYALDDHENIENKLRAEIINCAPCTSTNDSSKLTFEEIHKMDYLTMVLKENMRLYPPFWMVGRESLNDDYWGDFKVKKGTTIVISQLAMQRSNKYWHNPNSFIPERFLPENEAKINEGTYFPFLHGGRKCSGHTFVEMEARTIIAKLLPLFSVSCLNKAGNYMHPGISLKLKNPLMVEIDRVSRHNPNLP